MKKNKDERPKILITLLILLAIFTSNLLFRFYTKAQYKALINNSSLIASFVSANENKISEIAAKNKLSYEKIINGQVVYKSNNDLPTLMTIPVKQKNSPDVIRQELSQSLIVIEPHVVYIKKSVYLLFPLVSQNSKTSYLVFKKILP